jgi:glycosyltransferase 2 family protein
MKPWVKTTLKIVISVALLSYLISIAGIEETLEQLKTANLWFVPVAVALYLLSQFFSAYRWQFLSKALGFHLSLRTFYDYYLMGMFFSLFLPGAIGGDVMRMVFLARECKRKKREALLTLLAERGVGLIAVLLMTGTVCLLPPVQVIPSGIRYTIIGMSLAAILGYLVLTGLPIARLAQRYAFLNLLVQAEVYWRDFPLLARSVLISFAVQGVMIITQLGIAQAVGIDVPLPCLIAVYGLAGLISVLPIAFNGIGVREGAYVSLFHFMGIPKETALAFAIYWFMVSAVTSLVGGIVMLKGHYRPPSAEDPEMEDTKTSEEDSATVLSGGQLKTMS